MTWAVRATNVAKRYRRTARGFQLRTLKSALLGRRGEEALAGDETIAAGLAPERAEEQFRWRRGEEEVEGRDAHERHAHEGCKARHASDEALQRSAGLRPDEDQGA